MRAIACELQRAAKMIRRTVAATMPTTIALLRCSRGRCCGQTDDNCIVSRQCQIDHDGLEKSGQGLLYDVHQTPLSDVERASSMRPRSKRSTFSGEIVSRVGALPQNSGVWVR